MVTAPPKLSDQSKWKHRNSKNEKATVDPSSTPEVLSPLSTRSALWYFWFAVRHAPSMPTLSLTRAHGLLPQSPRMVKSRSIASSSDHPVMSAVIVMVLTPWLARASTREA